MLPRLLLAPVLALALAVPLLPAAAETSPLSCEDLYVAALVNPGSPTETVSCPGVGPGSALVFRFGPEVWFPLQVDEAYCSMSFLVTDGTDLYVTTAGHCVDTRLGVPGVGERVSAMGVPGTFGTVAYQWCEGSAANGGCGAGTDFALIRIDADKVQYAHADMCRWGGVTGTYTATSGDGYVQHFGWGVALGSATHVGVKRAEAEHSGHNFATQARQGLLLDPTFTDSSALIETAGISGDSGSGVRVTDDLVVAGMSDPSAQALGVFTHISVGGLGVVQRLDVSLERAGADMGKTFTLVTEL